MMKNIRKLILIFLNIIILFLLIDLFFGEKISIITNLKYDNSYRIENKDYHHGFKKNYTTTKTSWGPYEYSFCTNYLGFRSSCNFKKKEKYDLIFLGDSFTEGVGLNYEDTFVGLFENKSKMNILNLGVQSYSPSLHLKKINFLIKNKVKFKEAIIAIDISDLYDEFSYNPKLMRDNENNTGICKVASINKSNNFEIIPKIKFYLNKYFPITFISSKNIWWKLKSSERVNISYNTEYLNYNYYKSVWTYDLDIASKQSNKSLDCIKFSIKQLTNVTNKIYEVLKNEGIEMSLLIYPWPGTIIHDSVESEYVKLWKEFCSLKCKKFYNAFPIIFEELKYLDKSELIDKYYFNYDLHFNKKGNELIANFIYNNYFK